MAGSLFGSDWNGTGNSTVGLGVPLRVAWDGVCGVKQRTLLQAGMHGWSSAGESCSALSGVLLEAGESSRAGWATGQI